MRDGGSRGVELCEKEGGEGGEARGRHPVVVQRDRIFQVVHLRRGGEDYRGWRVGNVGAGLEVLEVGLSDPDPDPDPDSTTTRSLCLRGGTPTTTPDPDPGTNPRARRANPVPALTLTLTLAGPTPDPGLDPNSTTTHSRCLVVPAGGHEDHVPRTLRHDNDRSPRGGESRCAHLVDWRAPVVDWRVPVFEWRAPAVDWKGTATTDRHAEASHGAHTWLIKQEGRLGHVM